MDNSKNYNHFPQSSIEPQNVEFGHTSQGYMVDPMGRVNLNVRPSELNFAEAKPVHNYSIQTGEEFALEFMRDRVNPKKPFIPLAAGDPSLTTGYLDLKGILGISHTGSESGSDISILSVVGKEPKEFERNNSSLYEERSNYGSVASVQRNSSGYNGNQTIIHEYSSSRASDSSVRKIKILCSFGGKILPRPRDGKLRYVGGETRIIRLRKDISWEEIWQKTTTIYIYTHSIKYQLPGEDLDALVSVSSDEDLQNMMEECSVLGDGEGSKKLRMFLFSINDLDDTNFGLASSGGDSEVQYVVAVNGMDIGLRRDSNLHDLVNSSTTNLDELDVQNVARDTSRIASVADASSMNQYSESVLPKPSNAHEAESQSHPHQGQMHHEEAEKSLYSVSEPHTSSYTPVGDSTHPVPPPAPVTLEGSLSDDQPSGALIGLPDILNKEVEVNTKTDGTSNQDVEYENSQSMGKEVNYAPVQEASATIPTLDRKLPSRPSKIEGSHLESMPVTSPDVNSIRDPKSNENELLTSSSAIASEHANSQTDLIDLSYLESPVPPQSVFRSERYPREEGESLNRLTKSDDHGSQFLVTHSRSDIAQQDSVEESGENLHYFEPASNIEQSSSSATFDKHGISENGLAKYQNKISETKAQLNDKENGTYNQVPKPGDKTSSIKGNTNSSAVNETTRGYHNEDPASSLPDYPWGDRSESDITSNYTQGNSQPSARTGISTRNVSWGETTVGVSKPQRGDISIDINDRFPHDFLSDIFSKAVISENSSDISLQKDGALSMNIANHEPKHWSYFQKLANDDFGQKDVSLIDQDQTDFSSRLPKVEEKSEAYKITPLVRGGISSNQIDSKNNLGDQRELPGVSELSTTGLHSDYNPSLVEAKDARQFEESSENTRIPESEYKDEIRILPPLESSFNDFDISSLQIIKNEDLEELRELGSGTFGTVYHGKWRGSDVAIKRIKKSCFAGRSSEQERLTLEFWREAEILSKLHHPNVVAFYGVVQDGPGGTLATVAEFMVDGSLRHVLLRKDRHLDHRKKLIIAMDAAFGMEYLHSKNIVHFDLKCDNLLVNLKDPSRPICKVADFGLSKIKRNTLVSGGVRGTLPWMAPELLNGSSNKVSEKVDVFSFGIVLWEIFTGEEPYANMHYGAIIGGIVNNTLRPATPSSCDPEWKKLMEQCWAPNPMVRPTFTEITNRLRIMSAACQTRAPIHKASS
ncbi:putative serine/threonine-protein kinase mkcB [Heracleum sosnowskyi]|uniref:Serine/threonine-protein kinase mkcB n=1 Tax=Heracleum sosnowskyi TaxID=360622 RepID=A0AAD8J4T9_9APIA|nr:putative serine/threonine-protein kinase mkcB [Heracleum sosnowskyi]